MKTQYVPLWKLYLTFNEASAAASTMLNPFWQFPDKRESLGIPAQLTLKRETFNFNMISNSVLFLNVNVANNIVQIFIYCTGVFSTKCRETCFNFLNDVTGKYLGSPLKETLMYCTVTKSRAKEGGMRIHIAILMKNSDIVPYTWHKKILSRKCIEKSF